MPSTVALVVAAGRGRRMQDEIPKQYLHLGGKPILRWSLETLTDHPRLDGVRVVIHPEDRNLYDQAAEGLKVMNSVQGGESRQKSVSNGLESLAFKNPEIVLIHDGVRPFVGYDLIDRVLDSVEKNAKASVPALPIIDTLKRVEGEEIRETVSRAGLWQVQTPQAFYFKDILAAHRSSTGKELTDDASVAEDAGLSVAVVHGTKDNLKITNQNDLAWARHQLYTGAGSIRVGTGFDVHRFGPGDHLMLCGARIPFSAALVGHSDGDVGIHAVVDALLGAMGSGDIGQYFSSADERWQGANSGLFLSEVVELLESRGGVINHVDVTLICNQPRISDLRTVMVQQLAKIMRIPPTRISIKGTTTDGLGFTGRGEGVAAQAIATISMTDG